MWTLVPASQTDIPGPENFDVRWQAIKRQLERKHRSAVVHALVMLERNGPSLNGTLGGWLSEFRDGDLFECEVHLQEVPPTPFALGFLASTGRRIDLLYLFDAVSEQRVSRRTKMIRSAIAVLGFAAPAIRYVEDW
jgi:hypothetical protein